MKFFAITPDTTTCEDIINHIPTLKDKGVSFLYLRSPLLYKELETLVPLINQSGILPIISFQLYKHCKEKPFGIHFKSSETEFLLKYSELSSACTSASCHDISTAFELLEYSVDYVFVSPVFKPLSKQEDKRPLLERNWLKELIIKYGERIVLLGGLTRERIQVLQEDMKKDFSIAGITMFFGK